MIDKLLVVSNLVFCCAGVNEAETYLWEDADGVVH